MNKKIVLMLFLGALSTS